MPCVFCDVASAPARQNLPPRLVRVRGRRWRCAARRAFPGVTQFELRPIDASGSPLAILSPFDRVVAVAPRRARQVGAARARGLLSALPEGPGGLRAAASARMDLRPWQLEPALALVAGLGVRVLLADEVGLGKTVQAGLVLAELAARGAGQRLLVLAPAGLRDQWALELASRFGLPAVVTDAAAVRRAVASLPPQVNPWTLPGCHVASIDYVKQPHVAAALAHTCWDAVVIDEAHGAARGSDREAVVRALCARSRVVLLLTATPHSGDARAWLSLCAMGVLDGERGDRLLIFRRTRAAVGLPSRRRVRPLRVRVSPAEARLHAALRRYSLAVTRDGDGGPAALAMLVLAKRALSGAAALARSLERRLALLDASSPAGLQPSLPFDDEDGERDDADEVLPAWLGAPGLADRGRESALVTRLIALARAAAAGDSKIAALARLVRRSREPVLVFSEYRDTVAAIASALAPCGPVDVLHGGMTRLERQDAIARFCRGDLRVLVATDAASEGLNLHERCRLVVQVELPWSPSRIEQRIGRVDRLGQTRTVHAVSLLAGGGRERLVLDRLRERLATIERSAPGDGTLARAFDARPAGGAADAAVPASNAGVDLAASSVCERLARVRARRGSPRVTADGPIRLRLRGRLRRAWPFGRGRITVAVTSWPSADGAPIAEQVTVRGPCGSGSCEAALPAAAVEARAALDADVAREDAWRRRALARERALTACLRRDRRIARRTFQPSLFDRRAERRRADDLADVEGRARAHVDRLRWLRGRRPDAAPSDPMVVAVIEAR